MKKQPGNHPGKTMHIKWDDLPQIDLITIEAPENADILDRITLASKTRKFYLRQDWKFEIVRNDHSDGFNGLHRIPRADKKGNELEFDGASVPWPWLVSLISVGILRPLGVMLIASIVHDFMFLTGNLSIMKDDGKYADVSVKRHEADLLFRDIIGTVNNMPVIAYIAWLAVRCGRCFAKYNGEEGRLPVWEFVTVGSVIILLFLAFIFFPSATIIIFVSLCLIVYLITSFRVIPKSGV